MISSPFLPLSRVDTTRSRSESEASSSACAKTRPRPFKFDGAAGAFAYLLFILLYFPCTAALAAVYRETNMGWTMFVAGWTTGIAYIAGTLFYQAAIFARQPSVSAAWIGAMLAVLLIAVIGMRWWGMREKQRILAAIPESV